MELRASLDEIAEGFEFVGNSGPPPPKFDAEDLWPLTRGDLQARPYAAVAGHHPQPWCADDLAPGAVSGTWRAKNITTLDDLSGWWALCRDGASPVIADEDREFIAQALTLLPPPPYGPTAWKDWTDAVKAATGRKGKGAVHAAAAMAFDGPSAWARNGRADAAVAKGACARPVICALALCLRDRLHKLQDLWPHRIDNLLHGRLRWGGCCHPASNPETTCQRPPFSDKGRRKSG